MLEYLQQDDYQWTEQVPQRPLYNTPNYETGHYSLSEPSNSSQPDGIRIAAPRHLATSCSSRTNCLSFY